MSDTARAGAILTIDLDAIAENYRRLRARFRGPTLAAVVKADAYGTGIERVAPLLAAIGCREFFVAQIDEGIALRALLPDARIHVLNGLLPGTASDFAEYRLIPVLNALEEIEAWSRFLGGRGGGAAALPADIHFDTGLSRLGLDERSTEMLLHEPERLSGIAVATILSHLACSDEPDDPLNVEQLARFTQIRGYFSGTTASLVSSSGIFLDPRHHFDLARPGAALYGVNPQPKDSNPMAQVVRLQGKILQVRNIDSPRTVGYGATHRAGPGGRVATVAVGYADGYLRSLSNAGIGYVGDIRVPVIGRVSMDLVTLDVSAVPEDRLQPGALVDMIGPHNTVDDVARAAGTVGYEILTGLGRRYRRVYRSGA